MRIADIIQDSIVDGSGIRMVIFAQGCTHNCPGCHNPGTHALNGGKEMPVTDIIDRMSQNPLIDGITLSGGEPFLQSHDCAELAKAAHKLGLNVWCYTGYVIEELFCKPEAKELLDEIDVLVDGAFILEQKSLELDWRGSKNQRIIRLRG